MTSAKRIAQDGLGWTVALLCGFAGCGHGPPVNDGSTVVVPAGPFWMGSSEIERARATELSVRAGTFSRDSVGALDRELSQRRVDVDAFSIMSKPVTQSEYRGFVLDTGTPEPFIDPAGWRQMRTGYGYALVEGALWVDGAPKAERADHPAVLVTRDEAQAYCVWWGHARSGHGSLPTESQWEKAARGTDARSFPWGERFDPSLANTAETDAGRPTAAGARMSAASPYGVLDMAGNVFEWTRTRFPPQGWVVKGGAFNADASASRAAARHARPGGQRHPAIGFRCVLVPYGAPKAQRPV